MRLGRSLIRGCAVAVVTVLAGCGTESTDTPGAPTTATGEPQAPAEPPAPPAGAQAATAGQVDDARVIAAAQREPGSWLAYGQTYKEQRFSMLTQINRTT